MTYTSTFACCTHCKVFETSNVLFKSCIDVLTVVHFPVDVLFDFCLPYFELVSA